ncbi:MAG TPA: hypothetical protein VJQ57_09410 [Acidimicrobiia bacterium]|nr:hypothetical protein [Acidimicrobiia bacterium]
MSKARAKGTVGENHFLPFLRSVFGERVERAPLKGMQDKGDYVGVPWLHESKNTAKPLFLAWARVCEKKAGCRWVILWKGDLRKNEGPYVLMPFDFYLHLANAEQNLPANVRLQQAGRVDL